MFNPDEFKKDYLLYKDLVMIADKVNELAASLDNTLTAVSSDAIVSALEVYAAVKQNSAKVPGLNVANTEMAQFFKKTRKKTEAKA